VPSNPTTICVNFQAEIFKTPKFANIAALPHSIKAVLIAPNMKYCETPTTEPIFLLVIALVYNISPKPSNVSIISHKLFEEIINGAVASPTNDRIAISGSTTAPFFANILAVGKYLEIAPQSMNTSSFTS
jgi:hypothetical protein